MHPENALVHFTLPGTQLPSRRRGAKRAILTARETEISIMIAGGCSNREIAGELGCSHNTVATHVASIFRKLNFRKRSQIAALVGVAFAEEKRKREAAT